MKIHCRIDILFGLLFLISGCAGTQVESDPLTSPDRKALFELMVERCRALDAKEMSRFREIYTKDSPELEWIEKEGIPMWVQYGVTYYVHRAKRISIVGTDGAATFNLRGSNVFGRQFVKDVEALYRKEGSQWKIEAVGER